MGMPWLGAPATATLSAEPDMAVRPEAEGRGWRVGRSGNRALLYILVEGSRGLVAEKSGSVMQITVAAGVAEGDEVVVQV